MFDFKNMSLEELKQLSKDIRIEIDNRMINIKNIKKEIDKLSEEYTFFFRSVREIKYQPYVARCEYDRKYGIKLLYKHFEHTFGNYKECLVEGNYTCKEFEILDIAYNNIKYGESGYYIVLKGKLTKICNKNDMFKVSSIKQYLKGDLLFDNFLEIVGIKNTNKIIDDLIEED